MSEPLPLVTKGKSILHTYDMQDPKQIGKPFYFDIDTWIQAIEMQICSDEIQTALKMCDELLPGYYRDNLPEEIRAIRKRLYEQCYDQFDYSSDAEEASYTRAEVTEQCLSPYTYPRADILFDEIKKLNAEGRTPWIFEISPSHGWLPVGFADRGLKFNFFGKNMNQPALKKIKEWLPERVWQEAPETRLVAGQDPSDDHLQRQHKILVCFEALEHMMNPHDLTQAAHKVGVEFDQIYLSTPKYTLWGGLPNWKDRRIGHVRTWTPVEFMNFASNSFPGYSWTLYDACSMVLKGVRA